MAWRTAVRVEDRPRGTWDTGMRERDTGHRTTYEYDGVGPMHAARACYLKWFLPRPIYFYAIPNGMTIAAINPPPRTFRDSPPLFSRQSVSQSVCLSVKPSVVPCVPQARLFAFSLAPDLPSERVPCPLLTPAPAPARSLVPIRYPNVTTALRTNVAADRGSAGNGAQGGSRAEERASERTRAWRARPGDNASTAAARRRSGSATRAGE